MKSGIKRSIRIPGSNYCHDLAKEYWCPCLDDNQIRCRLFNKDLISYSLEDEATGLSNSRVEKCAKCLNYEDYW